MWFLSTKQILFSTILYCKLIFTHQRSIKTSKLLDDYGAPIFVYLPRDIIAKNHIKFSEINSKDIDFHNDDHYDSSNETSSEYSYHSDNESDYSTTSTDSESEMKRKSKKMKSRKKTHLESDEPVQSFISSRKPKRKLSNIQKKRSNYLTGNNVELKYKMFEEPSEFDHLSQKIHDPNSLLVKVYRGPTTYRSKGHHTKEPFASFGYYIKYPDSNNL